MRRVLPILLAAVVLAGCGGDDPPSAEAEVRDVLKTFAGSIEKRDYQVLCDDVFAPVLLEGLASIGLPCEVAMRNSLGTVAKPTLTVGTVRISKDTAEAEIKTSAEGQEPSADTIKLVRLKGKWKVSALGEPSAESSPTATPTPTP